MIEMLVKVLLAVLVVIGFSSTAFGQDSSLHQQDDTFLDNGVTAHRGNSSDFPENTMPAFESWCKSDS